MISPNKLSKITDLFYWPTNYCSFQNWNVPYMIKKNGTMMISGAASAVVRQDFKN